MSNRNLSGAQFFDAYDVEAANSFQGNRELAEQVLGGVDVESIGYSQRYTLGHLPTYNVPEYERATGGMTAWDEEYDITESGEELGVDTQQVEGIRRQGIDTMPPVRATRRKDGTIGLGDGRHRSMAAFLEGRMTIPAFIPVDELLTSPEHYTRQPPPKPRS